MAIRARAEYLLAEEYDAAQDRGEKSKKGAHFSEGKVRADEVLPPKELHEARQLRNAERADPGATRRALDGMLERDKLRIIALNGKLQSGAVEDSPRKGWNTLETA